MALATRLMNPPGDATPYRPAAEVLAHRMGQELMPLHLGTNHFFELNRTAARLWELLAAGCGRAELHRRLAEEFAVHPE